MREWVREFLIPNSSFRIRQILFAWNISLRASKVFAKFVSFRYSCSSLRSAPALTILSVFPVTS